MGLLLSVLITCVGVLEVIACYTHFRVGYDYTEAKSNIRDIAKYYAVELRKHELHFEPGPPGTTPQEETLSELMRTKSSVRVQERLDHNLLQPSSSHTPDQGSPNPALKVPRNSICGYDSPSIDKLQSPDIDISEAIDAIQEHENDASFWSRKSPSPYPDKSGLEVVESNFWRSRSPSPFPQDTETGTDATPELQHYRSLSPLLQTPDSGAFSLGSDLIENHPQNSLDDSYTPASRKHKSVSPLLQTPASEEKDWNKTPEHLDEPLSPSDLEVKMILESGGEELISIPRQPSPYPDILFSAVDDTEDTQFDEDFLRSLDGVKPPKCDDRRRTFRKKRNSSSTSSRTSRDDKSLTSLDESECEKRNNVDHQGSKEFIPVVEEESDVSGRLIHEEIPPEKCEHISKPSQDETVKVTKQEETLFEASVSKQDAENKEAADKGKANLTFTEKVKDLEISVQLMVTVKGTSQGDKMEYTTNVTQDKVTTALAHPVTKDESVTETTEKASEFGNVKTSVTYGNSTVVPATKPNVNLKEIIVGDETKPNLKDLQISSQSLIHSERTVQDDVATSEDDFLKLYESFTELPEREKDKFLMRIGHKSKITDTEPTITDSEVQSSEIKPHATILVKPIQDTIEHIEPAVLNLENKEKNIEINETIKKVETPVQNSSKTESKINIIGNNEAQVEKTFETKQDASDFNKKTEITAEEPNEKITRIFSEGDAIKNKTTVINETELCDDKKTTDTNEQIPSETKPDRIEQLKKESDVAQTSLDSSSETPPTIVENRLRRASKTSFEEASSVQSQEMLKRRVSNSEISSKQANQAFWLIFSAEYTNAMEKDWHSQHFSCWQCDESLTGQRYVLRDEHPYCVKCYEQVFANPCEKCTKTIGIDSKDLSYKEKHWHEACFQCTSCKESLVDKQFGAKGEKIYCGNCYDKQFASRCDGCTKIFHAGTKKMEYKNRQWHEQCFKCCKCENPIGTKSFIPREKDIYCAGCYEEKFATRCVKCNKAIQSGGVTYKNEPWHRECFTCTHCSKNLAGQRFTSRDDKPCCADCFGKLFAKRCTSCTEPITGIGGTRFISFEDRHWHNDCFICANCSTSLVGRGFITDEDKIICPECAKERFM